MKGIKRKYAAAYAGTWSIATRRDQKTRYRFGENSKTFISCFVLPNSGEVSTANPSFAFRD